MWCVVLGQRTHAHTGTRASVGGSKRKSAKSRNTHMLTMTHDNADNEQQHPAHAPPRTHDVAFKIAVGSRAGCSSRQEKTQETNIRTCDSGRKGVSLFLLVTKHAMRMPGGGEVPVEKRKNLSSPTPKEKTPTQNQTSPKTPQKENPQQNNRQPQQILLCVCARSDVLCEREISPRCLCVCVVLFAHVFALVFCCFVRLRVDE